MDFIITLSVLLLASYFGQKSAQWFIAKHSGLFILGVILWIASVLFFVACLDKLDNTQFSLAIFAVFLTIIFDRQTTMYRKALSILGTLIIDKLSEKIDKKEEKND